MLSSLSPLDGRYALTLEPLRAFFSEAALHRARVFIEISYFGMLSKEAKLKELVSFSVKQQKALQEIIDGFDEREAEKIAKIEATTKHDVKAVEYYLQESVLKIPGLKKAIGFLHFGLTSEDTNNLAYGILIQQALGNVLLPELHGLVGDLLGMATEWKGVRLLSLTHGQPATPTTVGKELFVFIARLERQLVKAQEFKMHGKLGGAVGNFSAHRVAYPAIKWEDLGRKFVSALGLEPLAFTTQINPHDDLAELSHLFARIDSILLNLSRDLWMYIARGVFRQKVVKGEVGSSTMPHKVNPIDFENAEGNLGLANALFLHFGEKLTVSRLQRDLSDSTVQRNLGVAFGHHFLAVTALRKGLKKLSLDPAAIQSELDRHPEVAAEAIQTVLRKNGVEGAYETLKELTRGERVTKELLKKFVTDLKIPKQDKERLLQILK